MEEEDKKMTIDVDIKKPGVSPPEKVTIRNCKEIKGNKGWDLIGICPNHDDHHESLAINRTQKRFKCLVPTCGFAGILWDEEKAHPKKQNKAVVAYKKYDSVWIYYDSDGLTPLHRTCKTINPRKFWQEYYDPATKKWYMGLTPPNGKKVKLVLYNLKKILDHPDKTIFILEGEKACDRFTNDLGLLATTSPMGAGNWNPEFNKYLKGRKVVAIPDNDDPGEKHVIKIADSNMGNCKSFKIIHFAGLSEKEDSDDWLDKIEDIEVEGRKLTKGEILQELKNYTDSEEEYIPDKHEPKKFKEKGEVKIIPEGDFRPTDLWNSESFCKKWEGQLLYCKMWNSWLVYREGKWQEDHRNETQELAKRVIMGYYRQASEIIEDKARKILVDYARRSESQRAIRAMTELAASAMPVIPDNFDQNPYILNLKNGTIDLKTLEFRGHKAEDMLTKIAGVSYKLGADCPKWLAFLDKIFEGKGDLIEYIKTSLGYSLTGDIGEQCLFILYGIGFNGKSTFINTIQEILGDYAISTPFETFLSRRGEHIPNDLARMKGARFVTAMEAGEGRKFNEAILKIITGRDKITARFLRQEYFEFYANFKLWLATNHKPTVREFSPAYWGRIKLIPFRVIIPEEERIPQYEDILLGEKEGIFNWILGGYKKWKEEKLKTPDEIKEATEEYKSSMDVVAEFIEQCCMESHRVKIATKDLYKVYKNWCDESGEEPVNKKSLGRRLAERGYKSTRVKRERGWGGIDLKDSAKSTPC